jgi:hypothetical protein
VFTFTVKATNAMGFDTRPLTINIGNVGIVGAKNLSPLRVYPNPTTGYLCITTSDYPISDIAIYDVYGRKHHPCTPPFMEGWQPQADGVVLDVSHLPTGVYLVNVFSAGKVIGSSKIVKQ